MTASLRNGIRLSVFSLLVIALGACTTTRVLEDWPDDLPPQQYFIQAYQADEANQAHQEIEDYLRWVAHFYQGRAGIMGWNDMSDALTDGLEGETRQAVQRHRRELGKRIAAEWAKSNQARVIDTAMLSLWGNVMVSDPDPQYRLVALRRIDRDVEALLEGELEPDLVSQARYRNL